MNHTHTYISLYPRKDDALAQTFINSHFVEIVLPEWSGALIHDSAIEYLQRLMIFAQNALLQLDAGYQPPAPEPMSDDDDLDNDPFDDIDYHDFNSWCDEFSLDSEFGDITCTDECEYDDLKSRLENELQRLTQADDSEFMRSIKIDFINFALTDLANLIWKRDFINDVEVYIKQGELDKQDKAKRDE